MDLERFILKEFKAGLKNTKINQSFTDSSDLWGIKVLYLNLHEESFIVEEIDKIINSIVEKSNLSLYFNQRIKQSVKIFGGGSVAEIQSLDDINLSNNDQIFDFYKNLVSSKILMERTLFSEMEEEELDEIVDFYRIIEADLETFYGISPCFLKIRIIEGR